MRANITERDEARSPLLEIERAVQSDAERLRLDPSAPDDRERLTALIRDHIAAWNDDHRRGRGDEDVVATGEPGRVDEGGSAARRRPALVVGHRVRPP
jgi:hypothetical protein